MKIDAPDLPTHTEILSELGALRDEMRAMRKDVASIKEIVNAWRTAKTVAVFIKWLGSIAVSIAGVWVLLKLGVGIEGPTQ